MSLSRLNTPDVLLRIERELVSTSFWRFDHDSQHLFVVGIERFEYAAAIAKPIVSRPITPARLNRQKAGERKQTSGDRNHLKVGSDALAIWKLAAQKSEGRRVRT